MRYSVHRSRWVEVLRSFGRRDIRRHGPTVRWVSSRGLASRVDGGFSGNGGFGGRRRARGPRGRTANRQWCESCPAGVQHSPSGAGARTVEVVRNHAGGSRSVPRGGGRSSDERCASIGSRLGQFREYGSRVSIRERIFMRGDSVRVQGSPTRKGGKKRTRSERL